MAQVRWGGGGPPSGSLGIGLAAALTLAAAGAAALAWPVRAEAPAASRASLNVARPEAVALAETMDAVFGPDLPSEQIRQHPDALAAEAQLAPLAARGDVGAQAALGLLLFVYAEDFERALPHLHAAAIGGDASSMGLLGDAFDSGSGVARSSTEAIRWWTRGAKGGDAPSKHRYGMALIRGEADAPDPVGGLLLVQAAAELGYEPAQAEMARLDRHQEDGPGGAFIAAGAPLVDGWGATLAASWRASARETEGRGPSIKGDE